MRMLSIASGSSGNCIYLGDDNTHIIVDAGLSGKKIEAGLNTIGLTTKDLNGILITHEHSDHIGGLGVISRKYNIPIYLTKKTAQAISNIKSVGKIDENLYNYVEKDKSFYIDSLKINPVKISHDAADPVAYTVESKDKKAGVMTDLGYFDEYIVDKISGLDVLLLEANHDLNMLMVGSYPYYLKKRISGDKGHLSNENSGRLLSKVLHDNMKKILLGHLSKENNYAQLAYETVRLEIKMGDNPYSDKDFPIEIADRTRPSAVINF
ncbi:Phosphoribosyl 1,2-cyclic phosphodiesterase [Acetitomaculum ruminis DSM 5522]|uniref:Phosphoribosyl 1,2-cyclic phosphodiesterase n=1 Tax=Acetitomaculum ruminis DSM 5522 TaxID=1120918 RepID=A0A1I0XT43_9FIRM|nr:MBL fold metallo-hydrolase [Acetitomaculum ruminis]SFB03430.1 Phosphoribosyl 1,2-cyclic phosphodiesterase [Acetitomaculum ruminis DSM 5522]